MKQKNHSMVLDEPFQEEKFLHSMINFKSFIDPLIANREGVQICEIGVEGARTTTWLAETAIGNNGNLYCVDPMPSESAVNLINEFKTDRIALIRQKSHPYLESAALHDIYFIDGDHNYFTVKGEIERILTKVSSKNSPILIFHDVSWPSAYRDSYYNEESLLDSQKHETGGEQGVDLHSEELVQGGFEGKGVFTFAKHQGGERNGVLKALKDSLENEPDWNLLIVPVVFGCGIAYREHSLSSQDRDYIKSLKNGLEVFSTILSQLEYNRLDNFISLLDFQNWHERVVTDLNTSNTEKDETIKSLEKSVSQTTAEKQQLVEQAKTYKTHLSKIQESAKLGFNEFNKVKFISSMSRKWRRKLRQFLSENKAISKYLK